ncbi:alpha/beta fold hydrolase [Cellulomonas xylanilytica]|uniref:Dihydrolipoamide acetyltransferase n=1 Tax=Cellulomonas xylanilytica TaxID=233583 RepID=A0A510VE81_9CELL|nr:alpha/beta hydrolase [Cellulomonas xylanilytica]GEK23445.1 dihydrolipoamide acetyltransferase [Cellulomonas xylanilytica]
MSDPVRVHTSSDASRVGVAPVFVLVHGIGASHRYFGRLHDELARHGDVHAVDLPGFGGLPRPDGPRSIAQLADALASRLDALGVAGAVLVGHSMGAQVVVELAVRHPALVSHLVLLGPVTDPERSSPVVQAWDLFRDMLREPPSANVLVLADYLRCGPRWYLTELPAMLRYPTLDAVRRAPCPVLVVRGADDPVARARWAARVAAAAADGRLLEVAGARHVVQHRRPQETATAITAFVGRRAPSGRSATGRPRDPGGDGHAAPA